MSSYLTNDQADAIAATLLRVDNFKRADAATKTAALAEATRKIDNAFRYQGRKYEVNQELEFPRVPYDNGTIWGVEQDDGSYIAPLQVRVACVYEAEVIIAGDLDRALQAQHGGLTSQSVGGMSESYGTGSGGSSPAASASGLGLNAHKLLERYRLMTGSIR